MKNAMDLLRTKVDVIQCGIPTYFDNYIRGCIVGERYEEIDKYLRIMTGERYEKYSKDYFEQVTYEEAMFFNKSQGVTRCMGWMGDLLFKSAFDFMIYTDLLWNVKPGLIMEFGSGNQSSAKWMASLCAMYNVDTKIISIDVNNSNETKENIDFIQQDCLALGAVEEIFDNLPRNKSPVLIIDDMHVCTMAIVKQSERFMKPGDYLYIEDAMRKHKELQEYFVSNPLSKLRLDNHYMHFFGNGICKKSSIIFTLPSKD